MKIHWSELLRRADASHVTLIRSNPVDGPERYVVLAGWREAGVLATMADVASELDYIESRQSLSGPAGGCWRSPPTDKQLHVWRLLAFVGGATSSLKAYQAMLKGDRRISREKLVMAQCEGRNHLAELRKKHDALVRKRAEVAEELNELGHPPKNIVQYRAALHELNLKAMI